MPSNFDDPSRRPARARTPRRGTVPRAQRGADSGGRITRVCTLRCYEAGRLDTSRAACRCNRERILRCMMVPALTACQLRASSASTTPPQRDYGRLVHVSLCDVSARLHCAASVGRAFPRRFGGHLPPRARPVRPGERMYKCASVMAGYSGSCPSPSTLCPRAASLAHHFGRNELDDVRRRDASCHAYRGAADQQRL